MANDQKVALPTNPYKQNANLMSSTRIYERLNKIYEKKVGEIYLRASRQTF